MKNSSRHANLGDVAYERLKGRIMCKKILPGERLVEEELAGELGVSRTPLREALRKLAQEGIVKIVPRRGAVVAKPSAEEVLEILLVREVLEGLAARLAMEHVTRRTIREMRACFRPFKNFDDPALKENILSYYQADVKFHKLLVHTSKNKKLIGVIGNLCDHMQILTLRHVSLPGRTVQSLQEHIDIIDALDKRDASLAEARARLHIQRFMGDVRENIRRGIYRTLG
ncbi:MAG: GntR family transcriptional regulator [Planctomycetota bacterium]